MQHSAGVLAYKYEDRELMVLLIHPGGPFFKNKEKNCVGLPEGSPIFDSSLINLKGFGSFLLIFILIKYFHKEADSCIIFYSVMMKGIL